ncbi:DUF3408 domain-containing protein [Phocaeicola vulgatus]|uniref:DUF3408 domain-containing protein n=1 Tax=Phocaeicola vulgatus TaxID=821 RepID=UPI003AB572FA
MGKVYESDIDPDEFIRSFREESSSLSSLKKPQEPKEQTAEQTPLTRQQPMEKPSLDSDKENMYMEKFVRNMRYMAPEDKFTTTEIDPDFIWKIRKILFCRKKGRVCSVKAYINNVLAAHFEEYADIINPKL